MKLDFLGNPTKQELCQPEFYTLCDQFCKSMDKSGKSKTWYMWTRYFFWTNRLVQTDGSFKIIRLYDKEIWK